MLPNNKPRNLCSRKKIFLAELGNEFWDKRLYLTLSPWCWCTSWMKTMIMQIILTKSVQGTYVGHLLSIHLRKKFSGNFSASGWNRKRFLANFFFCHHKGKGIWNCNYDCILLLKKIHSRIQMPSKNKPNQLNKNFHHPSFITSLKTFTWNPKSQVSSLFLSLLMSQPTLRVNVGLTKNPYKYVAIVGSLWKISKNFPFISQFLIIW